MYIEIGMLKFTPERGAENLLLNCAKATADNCLVNTLLNDANEVRFTCPAGTNVIEIGRAHV